MQDSTLCVNGTSQESEKYDNFQDCSYSRCVSMAAEPKHYRVIKDYKSPYPYPVVFKKGEKVKVGQSFKGDPDWKNWIWCEGNGNKKAWAPKKYVNIDGTNGIFNKDYNAMELSVQVGEKLVVFEIVNGFGMSEKTNGTRGWVPMKNMEIEDK